MLENAHCTHIDMQFIRIYIEYFRTGTEKNMFTLREQEKIQAWLNVPYELDRLDTIAIISNS